MPGRYQYRPGGAVLPSAGELQGADAGQLRSQAGGDGIASDLHPGGAAGAVAHLFASQSEKQCTGSGDLPHL